MIRGSSNESLFCRFPKNNFTNECKKISCMQRRIMGILDKTTCISLTNKTLEFLLVHYNKIISNQLFFEDDEKYV